jgi:hypothetical protein
VTQLDAPPASASAGALCALTQAPSPAAPRAAAPAWQARALAPLAAAGARTPLAAAAARSAGGGSPMPPLPTRPRGPGGSPRWRNVARGGADGNGADFGADDGFMPPPPPRAPVPAAPAAAAAAAAPPGAAPAAAARPPAEGHRFQEVVRGRARADLPGFDCAECRRFYAAVEGWAARGGGGAGAGPALPPCGHAPAAGAAGPAAAAPAAGAPTREELIDAGSRHRSRYEPPPTPDDFWNIAFGSAPPAPLLPPPAPSQSPSPSPAAAAARSPPVAAR